MIKTTRLPPLSQVKITSNC